MTTFRHLPPPERTSSTPLITPGSVSESDHAHHATPLSPPISPAYSLSSSGLPNLSRSTLLEGPQISRQEIPVTPSNPRNSTIASARGLLRCPFDVEYVKDSRGHSQIYGSGAWSTVYKATVRSLTSSVGCVGLETPPASPTFRAPSVVAVKRPARQDADTVLCHEGFVLGHLASIAGHQDVTVFFYGVLGPEHSLVLEAVPFSLEEQISRCSEVARRNLTTWNMSDPVLGSCKVWLSLASRLVRALVWLHEDAQVVHGDIKPGNILLRPAEESAHPFPFQTLLVDFSSSHFLSGDMVEPTQQAALSALTREYTAPELLSSKVLKDPNSKPTKASDVFSTAVTLLVAATGDLRVYPGTAYQRQAMATQGWQLLTLVRCGESGSRVPRHGIVERVLERAVLKAELGRLSAAHWLKIIEEMEMGEPTKRA